MTSTMATPLLETHNKPSKPTESAPHYNHYNKFNDIFPRNSGDKGLDGGGISGTVLGIISIMIAIVGIVIGRKCWKRQKRRVSSEP